MYPSVGISYNIKATESDFVATDLDPNMDYVFTVEASNEVGASPSTKELTCKTQRMGMSFIFTFHTLCIFEFVEMSSSNTQQRFFSIFYILHFFVYFFYKNILYIFYLKLKIKKTKSLFSF